MDFTFATDIYYYIIIPDYLSYFQYYERISTK